MTVVGLTGPTGGGKGEVAAVWAAEGIPVIDTDRLAREVVQPGGPCLSRLVEAFSPAILRPDGTLNRAALAGIAFSSPEHNRALQAITHPAILARCRELLAAEREQGCRAAAVDAPLLFESGFDRECDLTIAVLAPPEIRLRRIRVRDSLSEEQALSRLRAQPPDEFYTRRATFCVQNDQDLPALRSIAQDLAAWILRRDGERLV